MLTSIVFLIREKFEIICTYQNSELTHIRVNVTKVSSRISHVGLGVDFIRRIRAETCNTNDSDTQVST